MSDYSKLTDAEFDRLLSIVIDADNIKPSNLISIQGIYEILREHYNNDVLAKWEAENPQECDEDE